MSKVFDLLEGVVRVGMDYGIRILFDGAAGAAPPVGCQWLPPAPPGGRWGELKGVARGVSRLPGTPPPPPPHTHTKLYIGLIG